ncbi:MAG: SCO family protein [Alphaproteobacteria bacterium]|nr:SCO family protein [Alphaproteobacteria bacterium]
MTGPTDSTDRRPSRGVALLFVFMALALVFTVWTLFGEPRQQKSEPISIGAPITLADQYGHRGGGDALAGKFLLVTFGYTFCPDVCPTILRDMSAAVDLLGDEGEKVVPVFITIDPERDTQERMKDYAAHFHPRLLAFTGTPEEIAATAGDFHIYYARSQMETGPDDYLMDHTALVYLMAPDGHFITHFPYGITPENMMIVMEQHL